MERWLTFPRVQRLSLIVAALLGLPAWVCGFFADDDIQTAMLRGSLPELHTSRFELYTFATGVPEQTRALIARGLLPWFADPHVKVRLFRPLSSALFSLDQSLFGSNAVLYHAHQWLWFLGLVYVAGFLYRRALPGITGGLALLLFAVDDCHVMPFAWIASEHALISAVPAIVGLGLHLRYREEGKGGKQGRGDRWLALVGFAIGLLGGEGALGIVGYLFAYELVGAVGSLRSRVVAMMPALALVVVYLASYKLLGYGASGSGAYVDPIAAPVRFAVTAATRIPVLMEDLLGGLSADLWLFVPAIRPSLIASGVGTAIGVALLIRSFWPRLDAAEQRAVRWLALGAFFALLPATGGFLGSRVLLPASVGGAGILAIVIRHGWLAARAGLQIPRISRMATGWLAFVHLVLSPLIILAGIASLRSFTELTHAEAARPELANRPGLEIFILNASDPMIGMYVGPALAVRPGMHIGACRLLSMVPRDHTAVRTGPSTFELAIVGGRMFDSEYEGVFHPPEAIYHRGDEVSLGESHVRVLEVSDGKPVRIEITTPLSLDDPSYAFVTWNDGALRPVAFPSIGQPLQLPHTLGPSRL